METNEIRVGIADLKAAQSPARIVTIGLGSCVGITLFDKINNIGGLAHIMLPDSTQFTNKTNPAKFPDLAIPLLLQEMIKLGANKSVIFAKIGGGASMFNFSDSNLTMDIGNRNVNSVKEILSKMSIPLRGQDTGGNKGRTMILDVVTGKTYIKTIDQGTKEI